MNASIQNEERALSEGAKIWLIPDLEHSKWAQKLDWYLNFQLRRASLHKPQKLSDATKDKISSWGMDIADIPKSLKPADRAEMPLMIASSELLPNELTVQVPFQKSSAATWGPNCLKLLKNMKHSHARVFLPSELTMRQFSDSLGSDLNLTGVDLEIVEETAIGGN